MKPIFKQAPNATDLSRTTAMNKNAKVMLYKKELQEIKAVLKISKCKKKKDGRREDGKQACIDKFFKNTKDKLNKLEDLYVNQKPLPNTTKARESRGFSEREAIPTEKPSSGEVTSDTEGRKKEKPWIFYL